MSDNGAVMDGYTQEVFAHCGEAELYLLVKPGTDFSGTFHAWDMDLQCYVDVDGGMFSIELRPGD